MPLQIHQETDGLFYGGRNGLNDICRPHDLPKPAQIRDSVIV